ncbi:response regulator transcription factor [Enterobacter asburiae]|nr:response regulator transcription factor [Enterobacter asburiae]
MNVPLLAKYFLSYKIKKRGVAVICSCDIMIRGFYTILSEMKKFSKIHIFKNEDVIDKFFVENEKISVVIICDECFSSRLMVCLSVARISRYEGVAVMVMSSGNNPIDATEFLRAGAKAFMWKGTPLTYFDDALNTILQGELWIEGIVRDYYRTATSADNVHNQTAPEKVFRFLSNAEQAVIQEYMRGMTITQIALKKNRSVKTISTQKQTAMKKLGVCNKMELLSRYGHLHQSG